MASHLMKRDGGLEVAAAFTKIAVGIATIEEGADAFEFAAGGAELFTLSTEGSEKGGDELSIGTGTA